MKMRKVLAFLLMAAVLSACGNKGSLYLPDEAPDSPRKEKRS
jgi:predicted small lipoprotein YifL